MGDLFASLLENVRSLASVAAVGLASLGLGRPLWQWLHRGAGPHRFRADDFVSSPLVTLVWSVPLGWLAAALVLSPLAMLGWMTPLLVGSLTLLASILGLAEIVQLRGLWRAHRSFEYGRAIPPSGGPAGPPRSLSLVLGVTAAVVLVATLISAMAPPIEGLEIGGPLWSARQLLDHHAVNVSTTSSPLVSIGFAWASALDGPVAASLLSWAGGVWLMMATVIIAHDVLGGQWSIISSLAILLVPAVGIAMTIPLAATGVALWIALACHAAQARLAQDSDRSWLLLLGMASGAAIGADLRAWSGVVVILAMFAARAIRSRGLAEGGRDLQRVMVVGLLVTGTAYVLNTTSWRAVLVNGSMNATASLHPRLITLGQIIEQLGPTLWMLLPTLLIARRLRGLSWLIVVAGCLLIVAIMTRQMQLALAAAGPLAIAAIWSFIEIGSWPRLPRRAAHTIAVLTLLPAVAIPLQDAGRKLSVATGLESRRDYLLRKLPGYRAALVANDVFGADARVWSAEQAGLYLEGAVVVGDEPVAAEASAGRRRDNGSDRSSDDLIAQMRRQEITHLLVSVPWTLKNRSFRSASPDARHRAAWCATSAPADLSGTVPCAGPPTIKDACESNPVSMSGPLSPEELEDGVYCVSDYVASDSRGIQRRYQLLLVR